MRIGTTPWIVIGTVAGIIIASFAFDHSGHTYSPIYGALAGLAAGLVIDRMMRLGKRQLP